MSDKPYFHQFDDRTPPDFVPMSARRTMVWHVLAGLTVGVALWYLNWRWTQSLNPDAMVFSIVVASAETLFFLGTLLFFHDIWREGDTPRKPPPHSREAAGLDPSVGGISVDIFVTTYDEGADVVAPSLEAARAVDVPEGVTARIWVLDDGNRPGFRDLAESYGAGYITRENNLGYKAGNLRNALYQTDGDFFVICDADTRLFPTMLENTLGYFRDPKVAWVQTPHWFYDIPEGELWQDRFARLLRCGPAAWHVRALAALCRWATGKPRAGVDPFLSDPVLFFDVIQRRRNRNGASFCCGAGSIHRREAVFQSALMRFGSEHARTSQRIGPQAAFATLELQPFRFHVSEDIYTSIVLQSDRDAGWISVFHPQVESRMLSPWSMHAWATQKLKYAGGTFDIMFSDNPVFRRGMPWRTKLHYAATFWSYLSVLWAPIMLLAPVISLLTGLAPVEAYSFEFFAHFLPVIAISELAMIAGCKGHDVHHGRTMSIGTLPIQLRGLVQVLRGQKPRFPPTPKTPGGGSTIRADFRYLWINVALIAVMLGAAGYGILATHLGWFGYTMPFLLVNLFWLGWNSLSIGRIVGALFWRPAPVQPDPSNLLPFTRKADHETQRNPV